MNGLPLLVACCLSGRTFTGLAATLLALYAVAMLIVFINLLIATMNDTYDRVKEFQVGRIDAARVLAGEDVRAVTFTGRAAVCTCACSPLAACCRLLICVLTRLENIRVPQEVEVMRLRSHMLEGLRLHVSRNALAAFQASHAVRRALPLPAPTDTHASGFVLPT